MIENAPFNNNLIDLLVLIERVYFTFITLAFIMPLITAEGARRNEPS